MDDFPEFMKNPKNRISSTSQYSKGIEGYVFDGIGGGQMAFWRCETDGKSEEHIHDYDEYLVIVQGEYSVIIDGEKVPLYAGQEYFIPKGSAHAGEYSAGTRTIHAFGGKRAEVDAEM